MKGAALSEVSIKITQNKHPDSINQIIYLKKVVCYTTHDNLFRYLSPFFYLYKSWYVTSWPFHDKTKSYRNRKTFKQNVMFHILSQLAQYLTFDKTFITALSPTVQIQQQNKTFLCNFEQDKIYLI